MLREIVEKISNEFITEAISSPKLLADMAAMEKYMAESYSGRVFIELLQNADDCQSTKICIEEISGNIIFANDGRPFNENDVIAISRSGSSSKKRGETIGYRGIGFKSAAYLTDEIIIYSDKTFFTFSKKICSNKISLPIDNIPMIRIPLLIDSINPEINNEIKRLEYNGYNTVFIFKNAKIQEFLDEVKQVDSGMFIFLNHIEHCHIKLNEFEVKISLKRDVEGYNQIIEFDDNKNNAWYIWGNNRTSIGLKYDVKKRKIVACSDEEQLYHSYLPTFDKMLYPFKVNADFTTDPSRKHITIDEKTESALQSIAENIVELIKMALGGANEIDLGELFTMLNHPGAFSRCNSMLKEKIKERILTDIVLDLKNKTKVPVNCYKLLPDWLDQSEKLFLRMNSMIIGRESLNEHIYKAYPDIDLFIANYSSQFFTSDALIEAMTESILVENMPYELQGKLIGHIIKSLKFEPQATLKQKAFDAAKIATEIGIQSISEIREKNVKIKKEVQDGINAAASLSDLSWFYDKNKIDFQNCPEQTSKMYTQNIENHGVIKAVKPHIFKWRSAEQQCIEIETFLGNNAIDVSKKNVGYDIESTTGNGQKRYIEVKSIVDNGSFSLTNNEYSAAHQLGDQYYICLLIENNENIQAIYIQNPIKTVRFEKRIRQWEWYCDTYSGESFIFEN